MGTINTCLTREQMERFIPLSTLERETIKVDGGWCAVYSALRLMIDHDAFQRAEIARLTEQLRIANVGQRITERELDLFRGIFGDYDEPTRTYTQARFMWDSLKQQRTDAEARIKNLEKQVRPSDMCFCGRSADEASGNVFEDHEPICSVYLQARLTKLEEWIKFLKRDDNDEGKWESAGERCVDFYRNCDMALEGKPAPWQALAKETNGEQPFPTL